MIKILREMQKTVSEKSLGVHSETLNKYFSDKIGFATSSKALFHRIDFSELKRKCLFKGII